METSITPEMIDAGFDIGTIKNRFLLENQDIRTYSPLTLAYIGDAVYELVVRTVVVEQGNAPVNKLHKRSSALVKAASQAAIIKAIEPMLTEEEIQVYKRGRNAKSYTSAKNASVIDYRVATGFEALIGHLYLSGQNDRLLTLVKAGLDTLKNQ